MATVYRRPTARGDLIAHYIDLAANADEATADRFLANAEATFDDLAKQPKIGAPLTLRRPELAGLRKWQVRKFDSFLIFYVPRRGGVTIVRVLHAACCAGLVDSPWKGHLVVGHLAAFGRVPSPSAPSARSADRHFADVLSAGPDRSQWVACCRPPRRANGPGQVADLQSAAHKGIESS